MAYTPFQAFYDGIRIDYGIISNVEEYVDVDIYLTLPTGEEYLVRVFKETGLDSGTNIMNYRYALTVKHYFDGDVIPPDKIVQAVESVRPHVDSLILAEEKIRKLID
jgi:hypothetical protein